MAPGIEQGIERSLSESLDKDAVELLARLVRKEQYIGETYSIDYETAKVQVHDNERKKVGGIPSLSFLLATRVNPDSIEVDYIAEDTSFILLRVLDSAPLPQEGEAERIRVETAQRVSGEVTRHWDGPEAMDSRTRMYLGYAGVMCRIIGTFFFEQPDKDGQHLVLRFGSDISNYYPNRGLKVYKPNGETLETIVNYVSQRDIEKFRQRFGNVSRVKLGNVRYASTNRKHQNIDVVPVYIYPADLLSQRSALFGMTRTGKSNTTKIIAKSVYMLRFPQQDSDQCLRIGQLIFDPSGEYANENTQDNDNALKNIWEIQFVCQDDKERNEHREAEIATYGISRHPNDPFRRLMLLNFHEDNNLQTGKEIIDQAITSESPQYLKNFSHVDFFPPDPNDRSAVTRHNRRVLAYRAILYRAGLDTPNKLRPYTRGLFNARLTQEMQNYQGDNEVDYHSAAQIFSANNPTWAQLGDAFEALERFMRDGRNTGYNDFENWYVNERQNASGDRWADEGLKKLIGIFQYPNGIRWIGQFSDQHTSSTTTDYADDIYEDLCKGKLVIIDQSSGDPLLNESSARRIMSRIFERNKELFRSGKENIPEIIIYVEEAHNLLPPEKEKDYKDVWVRTAKEGAKFHIGLVYITQEVSSIQKNILKNTSNWFISHLNNTDETKELVKYYDFADFEKSIRKAQDPGFLRVKTLSNPFVVPAQIDEFTVEQ